MDNKQNQTFNYTYSAKQQEEIKSIRKKYIPPVETEDKMQQLRKLDQRVTSKASTMALALGIIGVLILGLGMSLSMSELSEIFGSHKDIAMPIGIVIGVVGIALVSLAYPVYNRTLRKEREKAAPEILRLADELMK